jgi:hypothetical protein
MKADIKAASGDRGELVSLAEPLLIDAGSRFRGGLPGFGAACRKTCWRRLPIWCGQ